MLDENKRNPQYSESSSTNSDLPYLYFSGFGFFVGLLLFGLVFLTNPTFVGPAAISWSFSITVIIYKYLGGIEANIEAENPQIIGLGLATLKIGGTLGGFLILLHVINHILENQIVGVFPEASNGQYYLYNKELRSYHSLQKIKNIYVLPDNEDIFGIEEIEEIGKNERLFPLGIGDLDFDYDSGKSRLHIKSSLRNLRERKFAYWGILSKDVLGSKASFYDIDLDWQGLESGLNNLFKLEDGKFNFKHSTIRGIREACRSNTGFCSSPEISTIVSGTNDVTYGEAVVCKDRENDLKGKNLFVLRDINLKSPATSVVVTEASIKDRRCKKDSTRILLNLDQAKKELFPNDAQTFDTFNSGFKIRVNHDDKPQLPE